VEFKPDLNYLQLIFFSALTL